VYRPLATQGIGNIEVVATLLYAFTLADSVPARGLY